MRTPFELVLAQDRFDDEAIRTYSPVSLCYPNKCTAAFGRHTLGQTTSSPNLRYNLRVTISVCEMAGFKLIVVAGSFINRLVDASCQLKFALTSDSGVGGDI